MRRLLLAALAVVSLGAVIGYAANYTATQGVGTTFFSFTNAAVNLPGIAILDSTGTNPASVSASNALKVDGSAVTQPVSGTVTANAGSGTLATSVANGSNIVEGNNTDAASCASGTSMIACLRAMNVNIQSGVGNTGAAVPASAIYPGYNVGGNLVGAVGDPCQTVAHTYTPISMTTATTTRIIAPTAAKKTYICALSLFAGAADNVAIVEGTGGTCGTGTAGVYGGTTAANGIVFAANEGTNIGAGSNAIMATAGTNVDFCLITSTTGPLSGHVVWVQQ